MGFNIDNTTAAGSTGGSFSDNIFEVYAFGDTTKKVKFQVLGTTGTTTTLQTNSTVNRLIRFPDADGFVLIDTATQNVSNKTLDNTNTITVWDSRFTVQDNVDPTKQFVFQASSISAATTRTLTVPDASGILTLTTLAQLIQNKTLDNTNIITVLDSNFTLQDNVDPTKQALFQLSGITAATTRTYTLPDTSGIILLNANSATVQNKTLDNTNSITVLDSLFTIQDNVDPTKQAVFQLSGITAATTRTYTLPDTNGTLINTAPGTSGNVLTSNGTNWVSQAPSVLSSRTVSSNDTLTDADDIIYLNSSGGVFTLTLSNPATAARKIYRLFKIDSSLNYISLGSYNINGSLRKICTENESLAITTDGTNWYSLDHQTATPWSQSGISASNFSAGWGTPTNISLWWKRVDDSMLFKGTFNCGTTQNSIGTISFSSPITADTTKMSSTAYKTSYGKISRAASGTNDLTTGTGSIDLVGFYNGTSNLFQVARLTSSLLYSSENVSAAFANSGDMINIELLTIPIVDWW